MKRKNHLVQMLTAASMSVMLCGCPGIQDDQGPLTVAKMDRDYSEYAYYIKCDPKHTLSKVCDWSIEYVSDSFYIVGWSSSACEEIVFTSRLGKEVESGKTFLQSTDSIIDDDPFKEIYEYDDDGKQDKKKLKNIIRNKEFDRLTRIK